MVSPLVRISITFLLLLAQIGHLSAGSAGVKNGTVYGIVRDDKSLPLAGVDVVLVRENPRPLIRSTTSNTEGQYQFTSVPVGLYTLGFARHGYESITTENGSEESRTAVGNQVRVYVESGALVTAPNVNLRSLGAHGLAQVYLKLIDQYTGEPVPSATLTLGNQVSTSSGNQGEHYVEVQIPPSSEGLPQSRLEITAPGFEALSQAIQVAPNNSTRLTVEVRPLLGVIQGRVDFAGFSNIDLSERTTISVGSIPVNLSNFKISPSGFFEVSVPVSTPQNPRFFTLHVHVQGFLPQVIPNIKAPLSGASTISFPIRLEAKTVPVGGAVSISGGMQVSPSGLNQAFITELGISSPIHGGNYLFEAIPTGMELTVSVFLRNHMGQTERGEIRFTATKNGQSSFRLPTIITKP